MRKAYLLCISILLFLFNISCKKDSTEKLLPDQNLINVSRSYFEKEILSKFPENNSPSNPGTTLQNDKIPRKSLKRNPIWAEAFTIELSVGKAVVVPVHYITPFIINSNFSGQNLYSINDLGKLLIYQDRHKIFHAEMITFLPDSNYLIKKINRFSGIVMVEDWAGNVLNRYKYNSDGSIRKYSNTHSLGMISSGASETANERKVVVSICYSLWGYNYSSSDPENGYYWSESIGCNTYFLDEGGEDGYGFNATGGDYGSIGSQQGGGSGTGGGSSGVIKPVNTFTISGGGYIIRNFSNYTNCFTNNPANDHSYSIMLCISQPEEGTRESWGYSGSSSSTTGNPVLVGHAFLVLSETSPTGVITRNVGFYPSTNVNPLSPVSQGQLNNDANHDFDIAVNISMTSSQFFQVLDFIGQGNSNGYQYNLNTNNCTTFALNALGVAGINLPRTTGTWLNGSGLNPGDLGEDLRQMQLPSNMTRTTLSGTHPNQGSCFIDN